MTTLMTLYHMGDLYLQVLFYFQLIFSERKETATVCEILKKTLAFYRGHFCMENIDYVDYAVRRL